MGAGLAVLVLVVGSSSVCSWRRNRCVALGNCCDDVLMYFWRMSSARTTDSDALRRSSTGTCQHSGQPCHRQHTHTHTHTHV